MRARFLVCEKSRELEENEMEYNNLNNVIKCVGKQMKSKI